MAAPLRRRTSLLLRWLLCAAVATTWSCRKPSPMGDSRVPKATEVAVTTPTASPSVTATDSRFLRHVSELAHANNVFETAIATDQDPIPGFDGKKLLRERKGSFPGVAFDHVVVFTDWGSSQVLPDLGALQADGTLGPRTVLPGVRVPDEPLNRLLEFVNEHARENASSGGMIALCDGCPGFRHSYIFYNATNKPVAVLVIALRHSMWWSYPDIGHSRPYYTSSRGLMAFYEPLCETVGAGLCFLGDTDYRDRVSDAVRLLPALSPLGRVRDIPLDEMNPRERRTLCAWASRTNYRGPGDDKCDAQRNAYGFTDGTSKWIGCTLSSTACERRPVSCRRSLSEVMPCEERALAGDPGFLSPESIGCRPLSQCVWGFETLYDGPVKH